MRDKPEVYLAKLETQIEEWRKHLDTLAIKAEKMTSETRRVYEKVIEERRTKLAQARQKLDALKHIGKDKWREGKATVESFWKEARTVFEKPVPPPPA